MAGDAAGGRHGLAHGCRTQIAGTGGAFALANVDGQSQSAAAVILDGFHLAQACSDGKAGLDTGAHLCSRGALRTGFGETIGHQSPELIELGLFGRG